MDSAVTESESAFSRSPRFRGLVAILGVASLLYVVTHELLMNYFIPGFRSANVTCFDLFYPQHSCDRVLTISRYLPHVGGAIAASLVVLIAVWSGWGQRLAKHGSSRPLRAAIVFTVVLVVGVSAIGDRNPFADAHDLTGLLAELTVVFTVVTLAAFGVFVLMWHIARVSAGRLFDHRPWAQPLIFLALGIGLLAWFTWNGSGVPQWIAWLSALAAALAPSRRHAARP